MFALCDCNNFYVSCERVFRPDLQNRPVLVLSNNDGCVVSRSNEVKAMGVKTGDPLFKMKDLVQKHNIAVFSSNYELYADLSNRVMTILSEFAPETEIYSIDECFLDFSGMELLSRHCECNEAIQSSNPVLDEVGASSKSLNVFFKNYGSKIVTTVERNTGIPVCLGVAPTKTLAKLANRFAKKYPAYNRVCIIDDNIKIEKALKLTEVGDVWGIGRRYADKLNKAGIITAFDFTKFSRSWVRKNMSVVGERIWCELQGESCLQLESVQPEKKQICTSRSFGQPVTEQSDLSAAVAGFAGKCAYKLRKQNSCAVSLMVFVSTNWFNKNLPQYHNSKHITLPVPTSSTTEIVRFACVALEQLYRKGYQYKKSGVIITEITHSSSIQGNIFYQTDLPKHNRLMKTIDQINDASEREMIKVAAAGSGKHDMQRNKLSPRYSTRIQDIISVKP